MYIISRSMFLLLPFLGTDFYCRHNEHLSADHENSSYSYRVIPTGDVLYCDQGSLHMFFRSRSSTSRSFKAAGGVRCSVFDLENVLERLSIWYQSDNQLPWFRYLSYFFLSFPFLSFLFLSFLFFSFFLAVHFI